MTVAERRLLRGVSHARKQVEGGTGPAVVSPAASTLRDEMAVSGQRLLAATGQMPMAAHILRAVPAVMRRGAGHLSGLSRL